MDRALWFLLGLRFRGWLRRLLRGLFTLKGALLTGLGVLVLVMWLGPVVLTANPADAERLVKIRRIGPLFLIGYSIFTLITSIGERAISFNPAEVNFLFSGPFSRRQLLFYKIAGSLGAASLSALFLAMMLRTYAESYIAAYVGLFLALSFIQLFSMSIALLASALGKRAFTLVRKVVLGLLLVALGAGLIWSARSRLGDNPKEWIKQLDRTPIIQVVLTPPRCIVEAFTAERLWPDLVKWALWGLVVNGFLLTLVLVLDAHYMETAAAVGERVYAEIQRIRRGGAPAGWRRLGGAGYSLPSFPSWGGIGPIAWRQLLIAKRAKIQVAILLVLMVTAASIAAQTSSEAGGAALVHILAVTLLTMTIFSTPMMPFDFRGDLDRIDMLKALPIPSWRLAVGQLVAPVFIVSSIQGIALIVMQVIRGQPEAILLFAWLVTVPFNFLLFAIDNLLFLWFPARQAAASPGDFQGMGRQMLFTLAKFMVLGVSAGVVTLVAGLTYLVTHLVAGDSLVPAMIAAWLALAVCGSSLIPLLALAFRRFDVARDTPP